MRTSNHSFPGGDHVEPNAGNRGAHGAACELRVAADLLGRGYDVFRSVSPHGSCDLVALKGDQVYRVEVRATVRRTDGTLVSPVRESDRADIYAFVCDGDIEYMAPDVAIGNVRQVRGARGAWRLSQIA